MANNLIFPDGVRLARLYEIPGPDTERQQAWLSIQGAEIHSGFIIYESEDPGFAFYGRANVDADKIWTVFRELCEQLLGSPATLVMSEIDDEPAPLGMSEVSLILGHMEAYSYGLAHDGFLQFGLVYEEGSEVSEVFVTPTKNFKLWFRDAGLLRSVMQKHGIPEVENLQFIDDYPRTTLQLRSDKKAFESPEEMILHMEKVLAD